jgi:hypothetical protein
MTSHFGFDASFFAEVKKMMRNAARFSQPSLPRAKIHWSRAQFEMERVLLIQQVANESLGGYAQSLHKSRPECKFSRPASIPKNC